jgi:outer membrane receptor protein involved in Fe transport
VVYSSWHSWGYNDEDASLLKRFGFGAEGRFGLTLRAEFFNVLNRHYWASPNLTMGSTYFGHVTDTTGSPRQGQLGVRFEW